MARSFALLASIACLPSVLTAQSSTDTTITLTTVTVNANRWHGIAQQPDIQSMDSLSSAIFFQDDLRNWLGSSTSAYVKDYGPGQSAVLSVRGGNAGHTAVQWNGFPLQHPMLGTVDLSLLPISLMDAVHLEHGAHGAGWGSGAVGGVLHLENEILQDTKWRAGLALGSFSDYRAHLRKSGQLKNWQWTSRAFYRQAQNDFDFTLPSGDQKTQNHAHFQSSGWMNGATRSGKQSKLSLYTWLQRADREIPPSIRETKSEATQEDGIFRQILDYKYWGKNTEINLRSAWFRERLVYENPVFNYSAESISNSVWMEVTGSRQLAFEGARVEAGIQQGIFNARSGDYANPAREGRTSIFTGLILPLEQGAIRMHLRREWNGNIAGPWVPTLQIAIREEASLSFFARTGRNYRWPTLNDRFWTFGGNPSLRPENGWGSDAGANWHTEKQFVAISASLTAYLRNMQDWIQWIPGEDQIWRPQNIQQVKSQGIEVSGRLETTLWKQQLWVTSHTDFTHAEPMRSNWRSDPSLGKQLIYVPIIKNVTQLGLKNTQWEIAYRHSWNSRTYTAPDHSESLPALHIGQLDLIWKTPSTWMPDISCSLRNLWNAQYQSVAWQAMPGRHILLQLNW